MAWSGHNGRGRCTYRDVLPNNAFASMRAKSGVATQHEW
jgi:hypothetical protein